VGARSRKRGRRTRPSGGTGGGGISSPPRVANPAPRPAQPASTGTPARSRSEERNAAVRASLAPLQAGERPWPITVSVVIAVLLGMTNLVLFAAGAKPHVGGQQPKLPEIVIFSGLMLMCAGGMWLLRYWAVLGFQTLLAIGLLGFCLALVRVSNVLWGLVCLVVIASGGYLFFKLVRVLSRLALPRPPGR
jgi:hypothetical protein